MNAPHLAAHPSRRVPVSISRCGRNFFAAVVIASCIAFAQAQNAPSAASQVAIEPATPMIEDAASGYFSDPYPIHLAPFLAGAPQFFSGTTKAVIGCPGAATADCYRSIPIQISAGPELEAKAKAAGDTIGVFENNNIYQDDSGAWQMATTMYVKNPAAFPEVKHWNLIVHAHPTDPLIPTVWVTDSVLVGSFTEPAKANYDGKYFSDNGKLYVLYSKRLSKDGEPAHDGIVAQALISATEPAAEPPVTLLQPETANGGFNSEYFFGLPPKNDFKLVETGNITKIGNTYVMAYSTGAYNQPDYKTGLAYSDAFLPQPGAYYRKIVTPDAADVWGQPDHEEVLYLLQSQEPAWPNYVAMQVVAPGVPSIVKDKSGSWLLYFAGFDPGDHPLSKRTGNFDASHRRPYFVKLNVAIPEGATVAATSDAALAQWITTASE